jgi:hypothetical protein
MPTSKEDYTARRFRSFEIQGVPPPPPRYDVGYDCELPPDVRMDDDAPLFGIADGGHTFEVIQRTVARLEEFRARERWHEPFVRVHLMSGESRPHLYLYWLGPLGSAQRFLHKPGLRGKFVAYPMDPRRRWSRGGPCNRT